MYLFDIGANYSRAIGIDRVCNRCDCRQGKSQVRDLAIIFRDVDLSLIYAFSEAIQQLLLESDVDRCLDGRIEKKSRRSRRTAGVVPGNKHTCAGGESLRVLRVERGRVRRKFANAPQARSRNKRVVYRDN